jgi:hypothetical protein
VVSSDRSQVYSSPDDLLTLVRDTHTCHTPFSTTLSPRGANSVSEPKVKTGSYALSWLVRVWEEPRAQEPEGDPVLRCFVRDLKTGEERYLSDPGEIDDLVTRRMRETGAAVEEPVQRKSRAAG